VGLLKFLILFLPLAVNAGTVELIVNAPFNTEEKEELYLTGNIPGHCQWQVKCLKLEKIFDKTFRKVLELKEHHEFDFKITRGSWETEAASSSGRIYPNRTIKLKEDYTKLVINIANWSDKKAHGVTGKLITVKNFLPSPLKEKKTLWIWLPPSYDSSKKTYPVLYMHDGQNVFDPRTSGFGNEWSVDEVMTALIKKKKIKEAIVVAIQSGSNRNGEYTYNRQGHLYADFLIKTLKPYIDSNYRTKTDRKNTYLMGSSMGALISFTILYKHSEVFSKAGAISLPPFAHDDTLFKWLKKQNLPKNPVQFYIDHGTHGQDGSYLEHVHRLLRVLEKKGLSKKSIKYEVAPYADHTELDWARRVEKPLLYLLSI